MLIRLEHNGLTMEEISSADISDDIVIGRATDCTWKTHESDQLISSHHARISRKRGAVWVTDMESKNGTYLLGKRIARRKLRVDDHVGIGNHTLVVERDRPGTDEGTASEIVVVTGKGRGTKRPVMPPCIVIGSDPECGLVLADMLVSRKHAEISCKSDGSCWIRDLGSKNGTSVNELRLRNEKERLLKDGDRISIAHLEIEFHDGSVKRGSAQAWIKFGIMAATLALAVGLYWGLRRMRPSAQDYISEARDIAALERFEEADEVLSKADNARGYRGSRMEIANLHRQLELWKETVALKKEARQHLEAGRWVEASRTMGRLQSGKKEAWTWNQGAVLEKERMIRAKTMLDALLRAEATMQRLDANATLMSGALDALGAALKQIPEDMPVYLSTLEIELRETETKLTAMIADTQGLENALDGLKQTFPPYPDIVKVVDEARQGPDGARKRRASKLYEPVKGLAEAYAQLLQVANMARALEFDKVHEVQLKLPSVDSCSIDLRVSQARTNLEGIFVNLQGKVHQVAFYHSEIRKRLGPETAKAIDGFRNKAVMDKVFGCDSLLKPYPRRSRKAPSGEYDRMLGIESFYTHLKMLPEPVDPVIASQFPFPPVLTAFSEAIAKIDYLDSFLNEPDNKWLLAGKLADEMARLRAIRAKRDGVLKTMLETARERGGREGVIAGGIALRLAREPDKVKIDQKPLQKWVMEKLKQNKAATAEMAGRYNTATFAEQIKLRTKILETGLPGDPSVRRMWVMRDAANR